ncbi:MAG: MvdC/MvdD family ATP grasp protein [Sandaracinobacteroides sp.]
MILIVSFPQNAHVDRVVAHLGRPWRMISTDWFPTRLGLSLRGGGLDRGFSLTLPDGETLDLETIGAAWYRRVRAIELDPALTDPTAKLFAWSESTEALGGIWASLDCFWMNNPYADERAQRKIWQLREAERLGLSIPDTLVTNEPQEAADFIAARGPHNVIRKAFRNIAEAPRETARLTEADMARLDSVRFAPVTFQAYVPADLDLRVTWIDGEVFTAAIRSDPAFEADYRPGLASATVTPYRLPDTVADKLSDLMQTLGLAYGAIDFRVTPEGEHVFLEVNPAGEYLFACDRTGQPVPAAIASCLDRQDRNRAG